MANDTASMGRRVPRLCAPFQGRGQVRHVTRHGLWRSVAIQKNAGKVIKLLLREQSDIGLAELVIPDILQVLQSRLAKFFAALQPIGNHVRDCCVVCYFDRETVQLDLGQPLIAPFLCIPQMAERMAETTGLTIHLPAYLDPVWLHGRPHWQCARCAVLRSHRPSSISWPWLFL